VIGRFETEDKPCGVKHKAAKEKGGAKAFRTPMTGLGYKMLGDIGQIALSRIKANQPPCPS